jgi:hypothetical protein
MRIDTGDATGSESSRAIFYKLKDIQDNSKNQVKLLKNQRLLSLRPKRIVEAIRA